MVLSFLPLFAAAISPLVAAQAQDAAIAAIAYRLQTKGAPICPVKQPQSGMLVHDISQYSGKFKEEARRVFGLGNHPAVLAVVADGAADRAGLRVNDMIISINGKAVSGTIDDVLARALPSPPVRIGIDRGGVSRTVELTGVAGCASIVQVIPGAALSAQADGVYAQINDSLIRYAQNDEELASVIAHEMAHNILDHHKVLDAKGRSARVIRQTESEADRFSVYLMARAGYDPEAPARFWARFGKKTGHGIFSDGTHPRTKPRVAALTAVALEIAAKQRAGAAISPDFAPTQ